MKSVEEHFAIHNNFSRGEIKQWAVWFTAWLAKLQDAHHRQIVDDNQYNRLFEWGCQSFPGYPRRNRYELR